MIQSFSFNQIIVPGSSIPESFIHHSAGRSITVELPPDWHRMVKGFAACAALRKNESGRIPLGKRAAHFSKADHIWFGYIALPERVNSRTFDRIKFKFRGEMKECGVQLIYEDDVMRNEFIFREEEKECGVRLIYEDDVMENASFLSAPCGRVKENYRIWRPTYSPCDRVSFREIWS